jgi:hypothetical protein
MSQDIIPMSLQVQNSRKSRGNNKGKIKHHKPLKSPKSKAKGRRGEGVQILDEICQTKSIYYFQRSDYKSHNSAYHPIILPAKWILD